MFIPQCCQATMISRLLYTNSSCLGLVQPLRKNTRTKDSKQHDMTIHMLISTNTICFKQGKHTWPNRHIKRLKNRTY